MANETRLTQVAVEVLYEQDAAAKMRVTQLAVEVLVDAPSTETQGTITTIVIG